MTTLNTRVRRFALAIAAGFVLVSGPALATAPETSSAEPGTLPGTSFGDESLERGSLISLRVSGSAMRPREDDVSYTVSGSGGCVYVTAGDSSTVMNTAVTDLPQGANVDTLRMYFYDTSGSNSSAWFTVYDLYGSIVNEWPVSSSGSGGNSFSDSAQINHTIDYSVYSYLINWRPNVTGSTMQLCGFRIFYMP
jgi:hypothetical protein